MRSTLPFRARAPHQRHAALPALSLTALVGLALLPVGLLAQQTSPAMSAPSTQPLPSAELSPSAQPHPQHHSQVTLDHGLLTVTASNASLTGLIREIARQTGMKITGSVAEDRVFGTYGPDDPQRILATLLDGTGSNILIRSSADDAPLQLILTPRTGAATPPNPNANLADNDSDDDATPPPGAPTVFMGSRARPPIGSAGGPTPTPSNGGISPASQTVTFPAPDGTSTPSTATTTPPDTSAPADTSSDTVKTPQQIFEQLQRLRQQTTGASTPQ